MNKCIGQNQRRTHHHLRNDSRFRTEVSAVADLHRQEVKRRRRIHHRQYATRGVYRKISPFNYPPTEYRSWLRTRRLPQKCANSSLPQPPPTIQMDPPSINQSPTVTKNNRLRAAAVRPSTATDSGQIPIGAILHQQHPACFAQKISTLMMVSAWPPSSSSTRTVTSYVPT